MSDRRTIDCLTMAEREYDREEPFEPEHGELRAIFWAVLASISTGGRVDVDVLDKIDQLLIAHR